MRERSPDAGSKSQVEERHWQGVSLMLTRAPTLEVKVAVTSSVKLLWGRSLWTLYSSESISKMELIRERQRMIDGDWQRIAR